MIASTVGLAPFGPVLERLREDIPRVFNLPAVRFAPVDVQDRPFSFVLRLAVRTAEGEGPLTHLFVKVFKEKPIEGGIEALRRRVAHDYSMTRQAYDSMRCDPRLATVHPVACYPELLAIVTEESPGQTVLEYLEGAMRWFPSRRARLDACEKMELVGRWIRAYQDADTGGDEFAAGEFEDYIDIRLRRLVTITHGTFSEADRQQILVHLRALAAAAPPAHMRRVMAHSDLSLSNVLVSSRGISVLDFAMTRRDSIVCDLAKVSIQLELLTVKPGFRPATISELQAALRKGFDDRLTPDGPIFRLVTLQHRINHLASAYGARSSGLAAIHNRLVRRHHHRKLREELSRHVG